MNIFDRTYTDLQKFIFSNQIVVTAAGLTIGFVTKEAIQKSIDIVLLPIFEFFSGIVFFKHILDIKILHIIIDLFWTIVIWIVSIVWCFLLLEYFLNNNIFGLASTVTDEQKKQFVKSQIEAKTSSDVQDLQEDKQKVPKIIQLTKEEGSANVESIIEKELNEKFVTHYNQYLAYP